MVPRTTMEISVFWYFNVSMYFSVITHVCIYIRVQNKSNNEFIVLTSQTQFICDIFRSNMFNIFCYSGILCEHKKAVHLK